LPTMLREHGADWLDAPDQAAITAVFVTVDEGDDYVSGRSISPREKTGSSLEDLIGAPQFSILALEALNFSVFLAGGAAPIAVIHLGATHPPANRLRGPHPQLLGHHLHRRDLRAVVVAGLEHHPHRTVTELLRIILYRSCHRLDPSKKSSLRTRREGSIGHLARCHRAFVDHYPHIGGIKLYVLTARSSQGLQLMVDNTDQIRHLSL